MTRARRNLASMTARPDHGGFVVEVVWLLPVMFLLFFAAIQFAYWHDGRDTCEGAAAAGAAAISGQESAPGAGEAAARAFLSGPSGSSVLDPSISEQDGAASVAVTCSGHSKPLIPIPGLDLTFSRTATAPKERWVTP